MRFGGKAKEYSPRARIRSWMGYVGREEGLSVRWEARETCLKIWGRIHFKMFQNWYCKWQLPEDRSTSGIWRTNKSWLGLALPVPGSQYPFRCVHGCHLSLAGTSCPLTGTTGSLTAVGRRCATSSITTMEELWTRTTSSPSWTCARHWTRSRPSGTEWRWPGGAGLPDCSWGVYSESNHFPPRQWTCDYQDLGQKFTAAVIAFIVTTVLWGWEGRTGKSPVKYTNALWCFKWNNKVTVAKTCILIFLRTGKPFFVSDSA